MKYLSEYPLWTALVTPLYADLSVDYDSMERLLRLQEEAHNAVVLFGSTGEGLALDYDEKRKIIEFACRLDLKVPIMVGVGGVNLTSTLEWLDFCETMPIDSYQLVTPPYSKPGAQGQVAWFSALLDRVKKPCMLYNIPSRAGCSLLPTVLRELHDHPNLWAMKEGSGSMADFHAYGMAGPKVALYCGDDALMPSLAAMGAKGLVSVVSNAWPKAAHAFVRMCLQGRGAEVVSEWFPIAQAMFVTSNPVPIKALLHDKGLIKTPLVKPPLSHLDLPSREPLRQCDVKVSVWEASALDDALLQR